MQVINQPSWRLIPPADIPHAEAAFLMGWTIVLTLWFFLPFVLPLIFTLLLTLVDVGLWSLLSGIWNTSEGPQKFAGYLPLATAAGGVYYMSALWPDWAGAVSLPLGRPIIARGKRNVTAIAKVPAN
jgi:succinate-acetate transporter protein